MGLDFGLLGRSPPLYQLWISIRVAYLGPVAKATQATGMPIAAGLLELYAFPLVVFIADFSTRPNLDIFGSTSVLDPLGLGGAMDSRSVFALCRKVRAATQQASHIQRPWWAAGRQLGRGRELVGSRLFSLTAYRRS